MMKTARFAVVLTAGALSTFGAHAAALAGAPPDAQYDAYFQPFDDNPVNRLHDITPLPPPTPLFPDFDPLNGLTQYVKTSRVVLTPRAVFALPVMTVRAGQEFDMPFYQQSGPSVAALGLKVEFDPKIVRILKTTSADWKGAGIVVNDTPDRITPQRRYNIAEFSGYPFTTKGPILSLHVKALAPGESTISTNQFDVSDATFNLAPALVRDGLVRVLP